VKQSKFMPSWPWGSKNRKGKRWRLRRTDAPWFDQPDALVRVEAGIRSGKYDVEKAASLRHWVETGTLVLPQAVDHGLIDSMTADLEAVWSAETPLEGLKIEEIRLRPEDPLGLPHAELVKLDRETRERLKTGSRWRVHGFPRHSESAQAIFKSPRLAAVADLLFDRSASPHFTINFMYGTEQALHQDMGVFAIAPLNHLIGAWVACEDVSPDAGPLVYYPGSQKEPMFPGFDNYPQTHLKTCDAAAMKEYEAYIAEITRRYERKTFLARKGDVLFWHGMVVHGGDAIRDRRLTRQSFVCHYIPPGMSVEDQIEGPFNW
jgi:phytanoyl-CoA hydroxylase